MSPILGIVASQISGHLSPPRFLASITTSAGNQTGRGILVYNGDIYLAGFDAQGGGLFQKITTTPTISVSKYLSNSFSLGNGIIANDGAGNFYLANTTGAQAALLVKINAAGAIQAQKEYGGLYATIGLVWDATNSVGYLPIYPSTGGHGAIIKVDSSLAISFQKEFSSSAPDDNYLYAVALDSSGAPHAFGYARGGTENLIAKLTTGGSLTWQINPQGPTMIAGAVDSSGNVYGLGFDGPSLFKFNSAGAQQWVRRITHVNQVRSAENCLILADDGFLYYVGFYTTGSTPANGGCIIKYNTSGTIQWQRTLLSATDNIKLQGIAVTGSTMYVTGTIATNGGDVFLASLPTDGSLTGTYSLGGTNIVYAAGAFTEANPGYTTSAQTTTMSNASFSATTPTYTAATSTPTLTKVTV